MNFIGIWIRIKHYSRMILLGSGRFYFCFLFFREIKPGKLMMIWIWKRNFNRHNEYCCLRWSNINDFIVQFHCSLFCHFKQSRIFLSNIKPFYRSLIWICVFYVVQVKRNEVIIEVNRKKITKSNVVNGTSWEYLSWWKIDWLNQHQFVCWNTESTECIQWQWAKII